MGKRTCQFSLSQMQSLFGTVQDQWRSRERLLLRLDSHGLEERCLFSDGNCQFAAAADQLFGAPEHHMAVRSTVASQLQATPERYRPYVLTPNFQDYTTDMSQSGVWGDHVTLQAIA